MYYIRTVARKYKQTNISQLRTVSSSTFTRSMQRVSSTHTVYFAYSINDRIINISDEIRRSKKYPRSTCERRNGELRVSWICHLRGVSEIISFDVPRGVIFNERTLKSESISVTRKLFGCPNLSGRRNDAMVTNARKFDYLQGRERNAFRLFSDRKYDRRK